MSHVEPTYRLTEAGAAAVMAAAVARARQIGLPMSIAIVDAGCNLLHFVRMDGGKPHTIPIAQAKARGAASNQRPTAKVGSTGNELSDFGALALTMAAGPERYAAFIGGIPVVVDGHCIGGIGVSGGTGEQDVDVARAGLAALATSPR
jgi:uncharacterized protein GlcG (DUF336 family)